jgi:hypothetical protein
MAKSHCEKQGVGMVQQFKNMNELVEYLGTLEERIKTLESENNNLRAVQPRSESMDGNTIAKYVSRYIPQTNLVNPGFLTRAFAVWGHFFVANLIIGIVFGSAYFCIMMLVFGNLLKTQ